MFKDGDDVVLFLYQPNTGGGYNTLGNYYYIVGVNQGVFYKHQPEASDESDVFHSVSSITYIYFLLPWPSRLRLRAFNNTVAEMRILIFVEI